MQLPAQHDELMAKLKTAQEDVAYCENLAKKVIMDVRNMWVIDETLNDTDSSRLLVFYKEFLTRLEQDMHTIIGNATTKE